MKKKRNKIKSEIDFSSVEPLVELELNGKKSYLQNKSSVHARRTETKILLWVYSKLTTILEGNRIECKCGAIRHFSAFQLDHKNNNGKSERERISKKLGRSNPGGGGGRFLRSLLLAGELEAHIETLELICACCHSEKNYSGGILAATNVNKNIKQCSNEQNTKIILPLKISKIPSVQLNMTEDISSLSSAELESLPS